jgi:hypothetical protein
MKSASSGMTLEKGGAAPRHVAVSQHRRCAEAASSPTALRARMDIRSLVRQSWHECAANFAPLTRGGAPRKCWALTLFAWIWRDARVLSRRRSFDQLNGRCARSIARVQATVVLLLDESLDLLLAPTLLALAPPAQVVIPAAWSPTCGTARRHLPMTLMSRWHHAIREDCACSRSFVRSRSRLRPMTPHHDR